PCPSHTWTSIYASFTTYTAATVLSPLSLHDALPIYARRRGRPRFGDGAGHGGTRRGRGHHGGVGRGGGGHGRQAHQGGRGQRAPDRKSTRLNSSHVKISYAVFCLKKKTEST